MRCDKYSHYLLFLLIILVTFSCFEEDEFIVEEVVMLEAEKTLSRLDEWKGSDDVLTFALIADLHSGNNDKYKHIGYLALTEKLLNYDFVVNLGDIGLNTKSTNTIASANDLLEKVKVEQAKFNCPVLFTKGNHDMDAGNETYLSEQRLSEFMQQPSQSIYSQIKIVPNKAYGYLDIADKKARIIFLDSNDNNGVSGGYSYHTTQLQWLINTLSDTPVNYIVVVLSHRFPDQGGDWLYDGQVVAYSGKVKNEMTLKRILSSFIKRSQGNSHPNDKLNLSWNFSNSSGLMVGVLCGDSHFDFEVKVDGVNIISTQGYGYIYASEKPSHAIVTPFNFNSQMLIDVVAIKLNQREMKYFRIGAGGSSRDREFFF